MKSNILSSVREIRGTSESAISRRERGRPSGGNQLIGFAQCANVRGARARVPRAAASRVRGPRPAPAAPDRTARTLNAVAVILVQTKGRWPCLRAGEARGPRRSLPSHYERQSERT